MTAATPGDALRRLSPPGARKCKICGELSPLIGAADFNKSCAEANGIVLPPSGIPISYNHCPACGFLFTTAFDAWTKRDFLTTIYNDQYIVIDPDYRSKRPAASAGFLTTLFGAHKATLSVLDYGGGNGVLAGLLREAGFAGAETYDPLVAEFAALPQRRFPLVCSFETLEHTPDPLAVIREISVLLDEPGILVFSTLVQPADFSAMGLKWWYVGPRNGHISIFTRKALERACRQCGLNFGSFDSNVHVAFRRIPGFARHLFPGSPPEEV